MAPVSAEVPATLKFDNATMSDIAHALASGQVSATAGAGYPSVMVPCGFVAGVDCKDTPDHPLGVTFAGRVWSEHKLLRLAYAYERASDMRKPPPGLRAR
ncbi:hypothetical protein ACSHT2_32185 [Bradyrhizobium sp. PUT101]|uniref:hypothetical protein n=1 Tax=Bradyrhizobium sp. PUT101 TaxID=3447427 RepID=UPI003F8397D8